MMLCLKPVTDFAALLRLYQLGTLAECASYKQQSRDVCASKIYAAAPRRRNSDFSGHFQAFKSENFCIGFAGEDMARMYLRQLNCSVPISESEQLLLRSWS